MFVERSIQCTSFSSRKQPENAGTERKQFTESASVALQQPLLTHAHTKCPPVRVQHLRQFIGTKESVYIRKELTSHRIGFEDQHGRRDFM